MRKENLSYCMEHPEYSIIIPIYNSEKELSRCINSVLNQTYKNFELFLVDDGSTDNSLQICNKFQKMDSRIKVIHKTNGGVSSARNVALDKAVGKYIVFIDSDDFVDKDMLRIFQSTDADLVIEGFCDYNGNEVTKILTNSNEKWNLCTDEDIIKFLKNGGSVFVWCKKYKKDIIEKYHLRFREDMKYSEDMIFNNDYILHANTVVNIEWVGYFHCQYVKPTLSASVKKDSFVKRNRWRKIAYKQYEGHEAIQCIYAKQLLYYAEKEMAELCKSKRKFSQKVKDISEIVYDNFFQSCILKYPNEISSRTRWLCRHKLIKLLVLNFSH